MDIYGHLYEDNTDKVTNALDAAFATSAPLVAGEASKVRQLRG